MYRFGWGTASRKTTGPALSSREMTDLDAVLLSHDHHADNLDTTGRTLLARADRVVTTRSGQRRLHTDDVTGLAPWATTMLTRSGLPDLEVTATPCRHGPPLSRPVAGEVVGFALRWPEVGPEVFWISGDTVLYRGVREVAHRLPVDVAVLHLGGVRFPITGPLRYSMTGQEAVELVGLLQPRVVVPVHYEGWSHFREPVDQLQEAFRTAPADVLDRVLWLTRGEPTELVAPG